MGVDVFKSYHIELGILDTDMYDHDLVYGVSPGEKEKTPSACMIASMFFLSSPLRERTVFASVLL